MRHSGSVLAVIISLAAAAFATPAQSEEPKLRPYDNPAMGCSHLFSGPVEPGDAALFQALLLDPARIQVPEYLGEHGTRICLDSPGGSLAEGVRIATLIHGKTGTAIADGATCASACSVIFMAGSVNVEGDPRGAVPDRVLHPRGRLGFHAPALAVPGRRYTETEVNRAFDLAIGSVGQLLNISGHIDLPETLIARMLATPASDMYYITRVGEAARWHINIGPVVEPSDWTPQAVLNACLNEFSYQTDRRGAVVYRPQQNSRIDLVGDPLIQAEERLVARLGGFGQERASECDLAEDRWGDAVAGQVGYITIAEEDVSATSHNLYAYTFYSHATLITALARDDDMTAQTEPLEGRNASWTHHADGFCIRLSGDEVQSEEACTLRSEAWIGPDLSRISAEERHVIETESSQSFQLTRNMDRSWDWIIDGGAWQSDYSLPQQHPRLQELAAGFGDRLPLSQCWQPAESAATSTTPVADDPQESDPARSFCVVMAAPSLIKQDRFPPGDTIEIFE